MNQAHLNDLRSKELEGMTAANIAYEDFHKARFDYVIQKCKEFCPDPFTTILDIGPSPLTKRLLDYYHHVTTLGFPWNGRVFPGQSKPEPVQKPVENHITYDLNQAQSLEPIDTDKTFDLIVFAEVIEHLHTAPELTLFVLKKVMKPGGYMIVQTPNAAVFYKRLLLLIGRNPYEKIRIDTGNPGHFREYTKRELIAYAQGVDFEIVAHEFRDYFGRPCGNGLLFYLNKAIVACVPSFRCGQTVILRKPV
jgi:SAM-dependent methyltransferase